MYEVYLEHTEGRRAFYHIIGFGKWLVTRWGRIGARGQAQVREYPESYGWSDILTDARAKESEKRAKGYRVIRANRNRVRDNAELVGREAVDRIVEQLREAGDTVRGRCPIDSPLEREREDTPQERLYQRTLRAPVSGRRLTVTATTYESTSGRRAIAVYPSTEERRLQREAANPTELELPRIVEPEPEPEPETEAFDFGRLGVIEVAASDRADLELDE